MKPGHWFTAVAAALSFLPTIALATSPPGALTATPAGNRLGLDLNEYALSWKAPDQHSYQVLVASDARKLAADVGDLWDSGKRHSKRTDGIVCRGKAFADGARVWWKVRSWDNASIASTWSEPANIVVPKNGATAKTIARPTSTQGDVRFIDGKIGKAVALGDHTTLSAADYPDLNSIAGTTIAAWIKPDKANDSWQCIYRKESNARRLLAIGKEGPFWGVWCGLGIAGKYIEFGAPYDAKKLVDGDWHHVAASYDGEHLRLYVDGEEIGSEAHSGKLDAGDASPAYIGSHGGSRERFRGGLDDLRVYTQGISAEAIRKLAGDELDVQNSALAARWSFDGTVTNAATFTTDALGNRIVLLGGTTTYGMEKHGHFETAVTAHWPHHDISFRNIGWPADDVFGTARGEFGSAQNTRSWKPPGAETGFGYGELLKQVREARPTTLIVGYGSEAAYADSDEKMKDFETGYAKLLTDLEATGANLILLTPVRHQKHGIILPDPTAENERLGRAADFIMKTAKDRGHDAFDVFGKVLLGAWHDNSEENVAYTNGVHLSAAGHLSFAAHLAHRFAVDNGAFRFLASSNDGGGVTVSAIGGLVRNPQTAKLGLRWDGILDQLPSAAGGRGAVFSPWGPEAAIRLKVDGELANTQEEGHYDVVDRGPDFEQAEKLRGAIVQKNTYQRYKLRPINKAYIFLFRRHEMGHLAREMEDFDELIEGQERVIAKLRVPREHAYDLQRIAPWKSPRDYPDHEVPARIPAPDPAAELAALTVADGFEVNLFASDPMIANPINLNWDTRGRAWVSTSSTYPHIKPGSEPNDRIVILEDIDGDGVADKHTVFAEGLTIPHSVMPVTGGAYVCSTTEFLFLADSNDDDVADSRRVVFSGFGNADVHHMIHGLRWTPWGDLHFTQSIYINSFVETPHGPRRMNGSGIWRFRPETERLEPFAVGMVNPWGFALDRWGQSFGTDGAGGSGPHYVFPGAAFPSAVGTHRVLSGLIPGKPKNTAAEFISGRHMPDHWQGSLLANDFRANRTVRYELQENGSGYSAKEVETVLHSSHRSFRPVDIKMGPEGAVYIVDWYNPIIDHGEVDFHHPMRDKSHGRIWRITAKDRPLVERPEIAGTKTKDLLDLLKAPEQYTRMQVNRELASRSPKGVADSTRRWLETLEATDPEFENYRLEALWLLMAHQVGSSALLEDILRSPSHKVRAAAVRTLSLWPAQPVSVDRHRLLASAVEDEHPQVRLEAVSALREWGTLEGANLALRALDHPTDNNLKFALELTVRQLRDLWLPALERGESVFDGEPSRLGYALREVNDPRAVGRLLDIIRSGSLEGQEIANAVRTVAALGDASHLGALLELSPAHLPAIAEGARFNSAKPEKSARLLALLGGEHRAAAATLCGRWGVAEAVGPLARHLRENPSSAAMAEALAKLGAFTELQQIDSPTAIAAWAGAQPREALAAAIARFSEPVIAAYLRHADGPRVLAKGLATVKIPEKIAIAGTRLAHASGRDVAPLISALGKAGGLEPMAQNISPDDRRALLTETRKTGDVARGREIYLRKALLCSSCHTIDNIGGKLGPDLTTVGSYMTPESLLESLLNPSTDIKQGYETVLLTTRDNTIVTGLLQRKTDAAHLIRDPSGTVISISNDNIAKLDSSPVSLMPPGLTAALRRDELVDLMSYLISLGKQKD